MVWKTTLFSFFIFTELIIIVFSSEIWFISFSFDYFSNSKFCFICLLWSFSINLYKVSSPFRPFIRYVHDNIFKVFNHETFYQKNLDRNLLQRLFVIWCSSMITKIKFRIFFYFVYQNQWMCLTFNQRASFWFRFDMFSCIELTRIG